MLCDEQCGNNHRTYDSVLIADCSLQANDTLNVRPGPSRLDLIGAVRLDYCNAVAHPADSGQQTGAGDQQDGAEHQLVAGDVKQHADRQ